MVVKKLKIMDINDIKANAGIVFNKQDPRFESVINNYIRNNEIRLLNCLKDSPYLEVFRYTLYAFANRCFFVQIKEKMYACGIENCSVDILYENESLVHCALSCSFHLYSAVCGFYRISGVYVAQKKLKKIKSKANGVIRFEEVFDNLLLNLDFQYFYFQQNGTIERLKWREIYNASQLNTVYFKTCQPYLTSENLQYVVKIMKNNYYFDEIDDIESVYMSFASPRIVGYVKSGKEKWEFYDFLNKKVKYTAPNCGYYQYELENYDNLNEVSLQNFEWWQKRNPLLMFTYSDMKGIIENIKQCLKNEIMYWNTEIEKYKNDKFEITFKSNFDKISNIAVIYASQFETFKRISIDTYYVLFDSNNPEHIEMMYFILRKMKHVFDERFMEYINSVSVLRTAENAKEAWQIMQGSTKIVSGIFTSDSSNDEYNDFCNLYQKVYNKKIKQKRNNVYNEAIAKGFKFNKWSSEQSLYALIVRFFNDAIYQYQDKWLGLQSLDVYIPSLKIAFEYQGEQHYNASDFFGGEEGLKNNQERDARKRALCLENGVTLIEWRYDEKITKENLSTKLKPFIDELPEENLNYTWEDEKLKLAFAKEEKEKEKKSLKPKVPTKVLVQYDIYGNYINHFISQEEASQKTGASKGTISFVINGRQKTSGGFVWRYFDADKIPEKIEKTEITTPEAKEVIQLDLDGNIIKTFPSITSASKICGICTKNIRNVINGKQKTAGGYKWKLKE